jgi:hypothetical protein
LIYLFKVNFHEFLSKTSERLTYPMHQEWNFHDPYSKQVAFGSPTRYSTWHCVACQITLTLLCRLLKASFGLLLHELILLYFCGSFWNKKSNEKVKVQHGNVACHIKNCASLLRMMTKFAWPSKPNQAPIEHLLYPVLHWTRFITCWWESM